MTPRFQGIRLNVFTDLLLTGFKGSGAIIGTLRVNRDIR